ncbi:hypothetical protein DMENIID0001_115390 [Sergentomyia squamirostris]
MFGSSAAREEKKRLIKGKRTSLIRVATRTGALWKCSDWQETAETEHFVSIRNQNLYKPGHCLGLALVKQSYSRDKFHLVVSGDDAIALKPGSPPRKTILIQVVRSVSARAKVQDRKAKRRGRREQGNSNQYRGKDPTTANSEVETDSEEEAAAAGPTELPRAARICYKICFN